MTSAFLITSGTYVSLEIAAEFGRIPPSFLPIGNRRLYTWQIEEIRRHSPDSRIVMSLPDDFRMDRTDQQALDTLGIEVARAPAHLSLGASLTYVILAANLIRGGLAILHGDTLLFDFPLEQPDIVSVGVTQVYYPWADYEADNGRIRFPETGETGTDRHVLTGAFHLSDVPLFLRGLAQSESKFLKALEFYSEQKGLEPISSGRWFDFGHLHTYFQSRRTVTTARHFNRLETESHFFVKSSTNQAKIEAELHWFETLPQELKIYVPDVLRAKAAGDAAAYRIEYCYLTTLNDIFVFGRLPPSVWRSVFDACSEFLDTARTLKPVDPLTHGDGDLYRNKTLSRLEQFAARNDVDLDAEWRLDGRPLPSLRRMTETLAATISPTTTQDIGVLHGDFCFSNILFDFRTQRVKVIDPRGLDSLGRNTIYGDVRYETAKLHHSVVGMYDHIIAGQFQLERNGPRDLSLVLPDEKHVNAIQKVFAGTAFGGRSLDDLSAPAISTLLFLSMLPLHEDNPSRQWGLLANALRLFRQMEG